MGAKKLTLEETEKLLKEYRENDSKEALIELIEKNIPLIFHVVKVNNWELNEDIISLGKIGLLNAINKYDYTDEKRKMRAFTTYISQAIANEIKMEFRRKRKTMNEVSIEMPIGHDKNGLEQKLEDILGTDENYLFEEAFKSPKNVANFIKSLKCLTDEECRLLKLRYVDGKTQREIAQMLNTSRSYISKKEIKALTKLRHPRNIKKTRDFL